MLVFISCITPYIPSDCVAWESRCCGTSIRICSQAQSSAIWIGVAQGHIAWLWVQEGYWRIPQHLPHLNMLGVPQPTQTTWNNKYSIWQHCFPIPMRLYFYLSCLQYAWNGQMFCMAWRNGTYWVSIELSVCTYCCLSVTMMAAILHATGRWCSPVRL